MARRSAPASTSTPVRIAGVGAVMIAAGLLAACSGSTSPGGSPTTSPGTSTATATVTTSASAPVTQSSSTGTGTSSASSGSGGGSGTDTSTYCTESQLRASVDNQTIPGNDKQGRKAVIIDFLNKSDSTCVLYGYPGAAVLDSSGAQVKQGQRTIRGALLGYATGHDSLVRVTLKPGAIASAGIEGVNQQEQGAAQAGCEAKPNPRIEVTPPNTKIAVPFDVSWPICYSFTVHPVNYR